MYNQANTPILYNPKRAFPIKMSEINNKNKEENIVKDYLQNELQIGSRVVYFTNKCNPRFKTGTILAFKKDCEQENNGFLDIVDSESKRHIERHCSDVIKIQEKIFKKLEII